ncbi:MAG: hypothetical protein AMK74_04350 [Nitrospira bacterium SM23_35]|nr:MAG: hypothetical protein AMK74_04350 [Nitrospira bacterium SM23_35]
MVRLPALFLSAVCMADLAPTPLLLSHFQLFNSGKNVPSIIVGRAVKKITQIGLDQQIKIQIH